MDGNVGTEARDPACLRWLGDGALSTGSTRARCGILCITVAALFCEVVRMYIHQARALARWRAFGDAMINEGQVTRARVLLWIHGAFLLLRLLRKLIDRSRVVGLHSGSYVCNVHLIPKNSKAS